QERGTLLPDGAELLAVRLRVRAEQHRHLVGWRIGLVDRVVPEEVIESVAEAGQRVLVDADLVHVDELLARVDLADLLRETGDDAVSPIVRATEADELTAGVLRARVDERRLRVVVAHRELFLAERSRLPARDESLRAIAPRDAAEILRRL